MDVTAFLANHVEAVNNLLYVNGAGISGATVPPGSPGPYGASLGIGVIVTVPWPQTDQQHRLRVDLVDADGSPVLVPTGPAAASPFRAELGFHVGRPPGMQPGDAQTVSLAIGLQALPLPALGSYQFTLYVDDEPVGELPYRIVAAAP